jgi:hypothetical protein
MARENGGREEIMILAIFLFRVCTEEVINRDCGESLMCNPSGSQQNRGHERQTGYVVLSYMTPICPW